MQGRTFSRAEAARLERALPAALEEVARRVDGGEGVDEDFLRGTGSGRSNAEQVLETGILAAAETHDDRKAEYIGNLVGGVAFAGEVGFGPLRTAEALMLIAQARDLTYRQYVLLALIHEGVNRGAPYDCPMVLGPLLMEVDGLYRQGMVAQGAELPAHPLEIRWPDLHVTDNGVVLYELMLLASLDGDHRREVLEAVDLAHRTA